MVNSGKKYGICSNITMLRAVNLCTDGCKMVLIVQLAYFDQSMYIVYHNIGAAGADVV